MKYKKEKEKVCTKGEQEWKEEDAEYPNIAYFSFLEEACTPFTTDSIIYHPTHQVTTLRD